MNKIISLLLVYSITFSTHAQKGDGPVNYRDLDDYLKSNEDLLKACQKKMEEGSLNRKSLGEACNVQPNQPLSDDVSVKAWERVITDDSWLWNTGLKAGDYYRERRELLSGMNHKLAEKTIRNLLYHSQFMKPRKRDEEASSENLKGTKTIRERQFQDLDGFNFLDVPIEDDTDKVVDYMMEQICKAPPVETQIPLKLWEGKEVKRHFAHMCYDKVNGKWQKVSEEAQKYYRDMMVEIMNESIDVADPDPNSETGKKSISYHDYLRGISKDNYYNIPKIKTETLKVKKKGLERITAEIDYEVMGLTNTTVAPLNFDLELALKNPVEAKLKDAKLNQTKAMESHYKWLEENKDTKYDIGTESEGYEDPVTARYYYFLEVADTINRVCSAVKGLVGMKSDIEIGELSNDLNLKVHSTDAGQQARPLPIPKDKELVEVKKKNDKKGEVDWELKDKPKTDKVVSYFSGRFKRMTEDLKEKHKPIEELRAKIKELEGKSGKKSEIEALYEELTPKEVAYKELSEKVQAYYDRYLAKEGNPIDNKISEFTKVYDNLMKDLLASEESKLFSVPAFRENFGFVNIEDCKSPNPSLKPPRFKTNQWATENHKDYFASVRQKGARERWADDLGKMVSMDIADVSKRNKDWSLEEPFVTDYNHRSYFQLPVGHMASETFDDLTNDKSQEELVRLFNGAPELYFDTITDESLMSLKFKDDYDTLYTKVNAMKSNEFFGKLYQDWKEKNKKLVAEGKDPLPQMTDDEKRKAFIEHFTPIYPYNFQSTLNPQDGTPVGSDWLNYNYGKALCSTLMKDTSDTKNRRYMTYALTGAGIFFGGGLMLGAVRGMSAITKLAFVSGDIAFGIVGTAGHELSILEKGNKDDWRERLSRKLARKQKLTADDIEMFEAPGIEKEVTALSFGFTTALGGLAAFDVVELADDFRKMGKAGQMIKRQRQAVENMITQAEEGTSVTKGTTAMKEADVPQAKISKPFIARLADIGGTDKTALKFHDDVFLVRGAKDNGHNWAKKLGYLGGSEGRANKAGREAQEAYLKQIKDKSFRKEYRGKGTSGKVKWNMQQFTYEDFLFLQLLKHSPKKSAQRMYKELSDMLNSNNKATVARAIRMIDRMQDGATHFKEGDDIHRTPLEAVMADAEKMEEAATAKAREAAKAKNGNNSDEGWENFLEENTTPVIGDSRSVIDDDGVETVEMTSPVNGNNPRTAKNEPPKQQIDGDDLDARVADAKKDRDTEDLPKYHKTKLNDFDVEVGIDGAFEEIAENVEWIMKTKYADIPKEDPRYAEIFDDELEDLLDQRLSELLPGQVKDAQKRLKEVVDGIESPDPRLAKMKKCSDAKYDFGYSFRVLANFTARERRGVAHTDSACPYPSKKPEEAKSSRSKFPDC